ncbi:Non-specific serine/threonine protein kinase [Quillaja saponaria]|uniref:non-specific serine/threonine protein kinase n=1 Tax=Quillaja saponaria TaxID=32244 RepID=A0AAD7LLP6_QUISA|nr:Non-specific serine/threonine protein kinase [Quillaja saponaria]
MSQPKIKRRVGKYEVGRTIGEGTFAKVKFARNSETGEPVALKILDKEKVLKHKMAEQIKREVATMKLIKHPNVVRLYEVMGSKTKIYIVLEFVTGGELFDKIVNHGRMGEDEARRYFQQLINAVDYCHSRGVYHRDLKPENLLLDAYGNLKVSDFGLSALSQQDDGLLHTTCGTPNYVAPEVLEDVGYDGTTADLWSCGVILFVLLAGYLPFDDSNLMNLYKKISAADFTFPPWLSFSARKLITRILDPNPVTRISIPEILEDEWFKKDYKPPQFEDKGETNLDDVEAVFKDSEEHLVTEKKEEQPAAMNAFELISMSKGLNLENLFDMEQGFKRETRFTSKCPANEIINKIEEAVKPLGFDVQKKNYKMRLENVKAGRKGNLNVATEVFQVAPSLHMVEVRKAKGDTLEFHKVCHIFH